MPNKYRLVLLWIALCGLTSLFINLRSPEEVEKPNIVEPPHIGMTDVLQLFPNSKMNDQNELQDIVWVGPVECTARFGFHPSGRLQRIWMTPIHNAPEEFLGNKAAVINYLFDRLGERRCTIKKSRDHDVHVTWSRGNFSVMLQIDDYNKILERREFLIMISIEPYDSALPLVENSPPTI